MLVRRHRRQFGSCLALACVAALLVTACGGGADDAGTDSPAQGDTDTAASEETITFRAATAEGIGSPMADAFDEYMEQLEECSDGRLVGEHFPAQQLGPYPDLIDGNRQGIYEMTTGSFATPGQLAPELAALTLGYMIKSDEHADRIIEELGDELSRITDEKTGVSVPAIGTEGARHLFSTKPIRNIEDLQGIKMRVPEEEVPIGVWGALGARPTPIAFSELYSALQTGVVDAAEGAIAQVEALKFYEPAPHLTLTGHWINIKPVYVNTAWLEGLPEDLQTCIHDVGREVFARQREANEEANEQILVNLEDQGVQVYELSDLEEWRERAAAFTDEYVEEHPEARDIVEQIQALEP